MSQAAVSDVLLATPTVRVGRFHVCANDSRFEYAGRFEGPELVFPRRGVSIEREDVPPFVADATMVALYNGGEAIRRRSIDLQPDSCDWFGVDASMARELAIAIDPSAADRERIFDLPHLPLDGASLMLARTAAARLDQPTPDTLFVEEAVHALLTRVLEVAFLRRIASRSRAPRVARRSKEAQAVHRAREAVLRDVSERWTLTRLGEVSGTPPFQLCRAFRRETGRSIHEWVVELRLREGVRLLASGAKDLAALALELGFATHSHFTTSFRNAFGLTPSEFRGRVAGGAARGQARCHDELCDGLGRRPANRKGLVPGGVGHKRPHSLLRTKAQ